MLGWGKAGTVNDGPNGCPAETCGPGPCDQTEPSDGTSDAAGVFWDGRAAQDKEVVANDCRCRSIIPTLPFCFDRLRPADSREPATGCSG